MGRRAVVVVPELPLPPRSGNAWRDLQQLALLEGLGFTVHFVVARCRWDLTDPEEDAAAREVTGGVTYLTRVRREPAETWLTKAARKLGYVVGGTRHPFGWWLPAGLPGALRGLAPGPGDALLLRSIFSHDIPAVRDVWPGTIVVDCHDSDVHLARELLGTVRGAARLGPWANLAGVRRTVATYLPLADEVWAVSAEDADRLRGEAPGARLVVVPSGMDERRAARGPQPGLPGSVLLVANFGYGPNARGADWLLRRVWPEVVRHVPDATLRLVGGRMPPLTARLAAGTPGVQALGQVADITELVRTAAVVAAPILEGGGTRLKIVEAWSQGKAVVTTAKGVEGLPWTHTAVAVEDEPLRFASRVVALLGDAGQRASMGREALALFGRRLSWEAIGRGVAAGSRIAAAEAALPRLAP